VAGRIVVFGATGYTGRLTVEALVERGQSPLLAGRSATKLADLSAELGGRMDMAVADVSRPSTIRALLEPGDVIVSTVGPFSKWGDPAAEAAIEAGAHYIDSTGEPPFIRRVFEVHGPRAAARGVGMLTAFGYDWVPGNLAGALALREAGDGAVRVDTGYFVTGSAGAGSMSGGTRASLAGAVGTASFAWREGALRTERSASRIRSFHVRGNERTGVSVGASEHFTLPRLHPGLREVNTYLGWFGPLSRPLQVASLAGSVGFLVPGTRWLFGEITDRLVKGSTGGPDEGERARSGSHVVGLAYDEAGEQLSEVHLSGVDTYSYTGRLLAWGAERAAAGDLQGSGALGPADGLGLDRLEAGCAEAGISRA
jgi:short subunit dehydrogenase-like uncharacterized protein